MNYKFWKRPPKGFIRKPLTLDGHDYDVWVKRQITSGPDVVKLVIASYQPDPQNSELIRLCVECLQRFTEVEHEIWIADSFSPWENIKWLTDYPGVNLALSRTESPERGSYDNAVNLEIARRMIDPQTKYLMTLHQDTVVTKKGWLTYLLSKFSDQVRAAGVREDKTRVDDGILHVLGYVIDYQLFQKLGLSYWPELPGLDVGDKAIVKLREAGYDYFATPNSLWDKTVIDRIKADSPFKTFPVDRSLDDDNDVIFMHLGRGVRKALKLEDYSDKTDIQTWTEFVRENILTD